MQDHRIPPKPPHFDTTPPGTCRWCNGKIPLTAKGRESKSRWHPACVDEYKLLFWPTATRKAVWKRDQGVCASCGKKCARKGQPKWHMDHRLPLYEAHGNLDYWRMTNLQTLCGDCHKVKTSNEATLRAIARKSQLLD